MRKKILWVSHFLPFPAKGGAQIRSFNLIKELSAYHDVSFFCLVYEDVVTNYFQSLDSAITVAGEVFGSFCKDIKLVPMLSKESKKIAAFKSIFSTQSYSVARLNSVRLRSELESFINERKFDAVHVDTLSLCSVIDVFDSEPIFLNHHNIESLMMLRRAQEQKNLLMKCICYLDAWKLRKLEHRVSKFVKMHIVCSDLDGDRLRALYPKIKTITIPNGIDCSTAISNREPDGKTMLFIGGLDWYPNTDAVRFLLSEIWPLIVKKHIDVHLDIVGKNPPSDIVNLASQYKNVTLHGFVDDISSFYKKAFLYICPIRDGGGTKLKVLDAMANGVPLLAHPIAMEGIDADLDSHYLSATTPSQFAEVVCNFYHQKRGFDKIGSEANRFIYENYDYKKIGYKFKFIY